MKNYKNHKKHNGHLVRRAPRQSSWEELHCCTLGAFGQSTKLIMRETGLKEGQVCGILYRNNIRRKDFRNGENVFAQVLIQKLEQTTTRQLSSGIQTYDQVEAEMKERLRNMKALHLPPQAMKLLKA